LNKAKESELRAAEKIEEVKYQHAKEIDKHQEKAVIALDKANDKIVNRQIY